MHGQEGYSSQLGQGSYPAPPFQQGPSSTTGLPPPPPLYPGPLNAQPHLIRQGPPPFHIAPGGHAYQHALLGTPHPGPPAATLSGGSSQMLHSYAASGQHLSWSQTLHQVHSSTTPPIPIAYHMPSSQGGTEQVPPRQPSFRHVPPPPPPPGNSKCSTAGSFESHLHSVQQQSSSRPMGPLPPQPPPPPPTSSPPGVPPVPSSPLFESMARNFAGRSLNEDIADRNHVILDTQPTVNLMHDKGEPKPNIEIPQRSTEDNQSEVRSAVVLTHPADDSDMDMEDDITQPEEEEHNHLSGNVNDEIVSTHGVDVEQLRSSKHSGIDWPSEISLDESVPFTGSCVLKDKKDSEVPKGVCSDADSITSNGDTEQTLNVSPNKSSRNVSMGSAETGNEKLAGQLIGNANPFKLLQGYTSENSSENESKNLHAEDVPKSIQVDPEACNTAEPRPKFFSESKQCTTLKSMVKSSTHAVETDTVSFSTRKEKTYADKFIIDQETSGNDIYTAAQSRDSSRNNTDVGREGINLLKADAKDNSPRLNVDEFGRLVRAGGSGSDTSGSPRYTRRHMRRSRKRSRSQSRSRSPQDRRPRSPRRRKERRRRSRSVSPKRQRSRSRSPGLKRGGEYFGGKGRRDRSERPECFDFRRGKCYRGSTCKFSHHESNKSERLRHNRGLGRSQDMAFSRLSHDFTEDAEETPEKFVFENKELMDKGLRIPLDVHGLNEIEDARETIGVPFDCSPDKLNGTDSLSIHNAGRFSGCSAHDVPSGGKNNLIQEIPAGVSEDQPKNLDDSLLCESSLRQSSTARLSKWDSGSNPVDQPHLVETPVTMSLSAEEVPSQSLSSRELSLSVTNQPCQLPPLPSIPEVTRASVTPQDYHMMPSLVQSHFNPVNYSPYQAPVSYKHSHFPDPSNHSSGSFLTPSGPLRARSNVNAATGGYNTFPQHMQEPLLHLQNDSSNYASARIYASEFPDPSQSGQYQAFPPALDPGQTQNTIVDFRSRNLHTSNLVSQQGDRVTGHPQNMNPFHSFAQIQPDSVEVQSPAKIMHASLGESQPPYTHPYSQQASNHLHYSGADGFSAQRGEAGKDSSSMFGFAPELEKKMPSGVTNFLRSRISNHFNPYASTFEQPIGSNISSNPLTQENETTFSAKLNALSGMSSFPVNEGGSLGPKNMIVASNTAAGSIQPRSAGDQYDPLFDSIEPASNSFSKNETTGDSDNILRLNGCGKTFNMGEMKEEGVAAISTNNSVENEEYGETADAEVGAVLDGSPSNPNNPNVGEFEIDQVKSSGKRKGKDSRSMKLFKISVAAFVKAVLKPSWRQGNMSKEAFKTIVKKTVDKVSGAMKGRQIPKSQEKINHYIDSSRGKLTKLVMGYVDKYVKV